MPKCAKIYLGFVLIRHDEANRSGNYSIEKIVYYLRFPRGRNMPCDIGPHGEVPTQLGGRRKEGENIDQGLY